MHFNSFFTSFTRPFSCMDFNTFLKVKEDEHNPLKVRNIFILVKKGRKNLDSKLVVGHKLSYEYQKSCWTNKGISSTRIAYLISDNCDYANYLCISSVIDFLEYISSNHVNL